MNIEKSLAKTAFNNREYMFEHLPYEREMAFYQSIKMGNINEVNRLFKPLCSEGMGKLSEDSLRNLKYHLVITVAFITRYCIEGGMEAEYAYNLSDAYIQQIDKCRNEGEIHVLHRELVNDYADRMHAVIKDKVFSKPVVQCVDYIFNHLHYKITLNELADEVGLSESYLSKLFHKEMGVTISHYIISKRVEAAENLLKFSEYSYVDIANYLCFNSESYFIHVFKSYTKMTPKEYRNKFFRTRWGNKN